MGEKKGKKKPDIFWTRKVGKKRAKRSLTFFGSHHMSGFFLPTFMSRSQIWAKRSLGKKRAKKACNGTAPLPHQFYYECFLMGHQEDCHSMSQVHYCVVVCSVIVKGYSCSDSAGETQLMPKLLNDFH